MDRMDIAIYVRGCHQLGIVVYMIGSIMDNGLSSWLL